MKEFSTQNTQKYFGKCVTLASTDVIRSTSVENWVENSETMSFEWTFMHLTYTDLNTEWLCT